MEGDGVPGSRVRELQLGGMQCYPLDAAFFGFFRTVLAIADQGMSDGGELSPDLVLQSSDEFNADQCGIREGLFYFVMQFGPGGMLVTLRA